MTTKKSKSSETSENATDGQAPNPKYLDESIGQIGPEDFPNPEWEAWGGPPDMSPDGLVTEGVAKGAYKQPAKKYITPAAHFVERFGTMHAATTPYHPYTLAVGMNAVREYFQGQGYSDAEAGMMAVAAFDLHVKSGLLLNPDRGRMSVEMSKQGRDINTEQEAFERTQAQRYVQMQESGALQAQPPDIDFEALEKAIPSPIQTPVVAKPVPVVDDAVINRESEA